MIVSALLGIGLVAVVATLVLWRKTAPPPPSHLSGRLFWQVNAEDGVAPTVELPEEVLRGATNHDGSKLYVSVLGRKRLLVLDTATLAISAIELPELPGPIVITKGGDLAYVGSLSGALMIVELPGGRVREIIQAPGPISDLALTPDGGIMFLAMMQKGVKKLDLRSRDWSVITSFPCPWYNRLDREGKRLVVSFQCGGPSGREGHDAVEIYDVASGQRIDSLVGPPIVGGAHEFSPDGRTLWISGGDACLSSRYDHQGCPEVPAWVGHVYDTVARKLLRTFTMPLDGGVTASFIGDGSRVLLAGKSAYVYDAFSFVPLEMRRSPRFRTTGSVHVSPDGQTAVFINDGKKVSVLNGQPRSCADLGPGAVHFLGLDGASHDSLDAAKISPEEAVRYEPGFVGQALSLDGEGPGLEVRSPNMYRFGFADSSIAFYVKAPQLRSAGLFEYAEPKLGILWRLSTNDDGALAFTFRGVRGVELVASATRTVTDGRWHHVVLTKTEQTISIFQDGQLEASAQTKNGNVLVGGNDDQALKLGWSSSKPLPRFRGLLDEIAMWARALSAEEIHQIYARQSSKPCRP